MIRAASCSTAVGVARPTGLASSRQVGNLRKGGSRRVAVRTVNKPGASTVNGGGWKGLSGVDVDVLEEKETGEEFDWAKAWYPIAVLEDLEPLRPTPVEVLGRKFVVWRDVEGEWRCFEDACPHRLAPLSEGRIEEKDGSLMCSYHGWRFGGDGGCVSVPQAKEGEERICGNPRARVKSFPVKVVADLLWLWPEDSPFAFINSAATYPPYGGYEEEDFFQMYTPYRRIMPYPMDVLLENVVDLSHVPFAHHGVQGDRDSAGWYRVKQEKPESPESVFSLTMESMSNIKELEVMAKILFSGGKVSQVMEFTPPSVVKYSFYTDKEPEAQSYVMAITVPVSDVQSLMFWRVLVRKSTMPKLTSLLVNTWRPKWINHMESTAVLNGDMILLCEQANTLRGRAERGEPWSSAFFCPTTADVPVLLFREWFHGKIGGGGPKRPNGKPLLQGRLPPRDRETLLESYNSHTKDCKVCSGALRNLKILQKVASFGGYVLGVAWLIYVKQISLNGGVYLHMSLLLTIGTLLLLSRKFHQMQQHFLYVDYPHWKR